MILRPAPMPPAPFAALAVLVASLLVVAPAQAQTDADAQARAHYDRALVHYNLSEWDEAIREFKKAYELSKAPGLLFNIAQAYRLQGNKRMVLSSYKSYLRLDPGAPNRAEVEARIAELDKAIAEDKPTGPAPRVEPKPVAPPPAGTPP